MRPEFKKLNPQHTVPILQDGDDVILDGSAICTYICQRYGAAEQTLVPADPFSRALVEQRQHFSDSKLFNIFYKMMTDINVRAKEISADDVNDTLDALAVLEAFLGGNSFVCGDNLTVADFSLISTGTAMLTVLKETTKGGGDGLEMKFPNIYGWINRMSALLQQADYEKIVSQTNEFLVELLVAAMNRK